MDPSIKQQKIRVVAAVIRRNARYLLCQRPTHKRHGGLWEFPGGKLEPGETIVDATRRELAEELAVEVSRVGDIQFSIEDPGSDFVIEFRPVDIAGDPQCLEHSNVEWVSRDELLNRALAPSDLQFARYVVSQAAHDE
ncbi:MAG: (deoxy)nucleoside triphosphate pyrophosphohydrolase [bacterium]